MEGLGQRHEAGRYGERPQTADPGWTTDHRGEGRHPILAPEDHRRAECTRRSAGSSAGSRRASGALPTPTAA